jgi:catechol-2,3-dioxygenase
MQAGDFYQTLVAIFQTLRRQTPKYQDFEIRQNIESHRGRFCSSGDEHHIIAVVHSWLLQRIYATTEEYAL